MPNLEQRLQAAHEYYFKRLIRTGLRDDARKALQRRQDVATARWSGTGYDPGVLSSLYDTVAAYCFEMLVPLDRSVGRIAPLSAFDKDVALVVVDYAGADIIWLTRKIEYGDPIQIGDRWKACYNMSKAPKGSLKNGTQPLDDHRFASQINYGASEIVVHFSTHGDVLDVFNRGDLMTSVAAVAQINDVNVRLTAWRYSGGPSLPDAMKLKGLS